MAEKTEFGTKQVLLFALLLLVVSFLGVLLGGWFNDWRRARSAVSHEARPQVESLLKVETAFPSVELADLEGNPVQLAEHMAGRKTIVLFLSAGCEPCAAGIEAWKGEAGQLAEDLVVIGVCADPADATARYREESGFPYLMFCDPKLVFVHEYKVTSFPSVFGVDESGTIRSVSTGYRPGFTLAQVYEELDGS